MAREFAGNFYHTTKWKKCRESYIKSVFGLCERCGASGNTVHHKIHLNADNINDSSITLGHENLELLCRKCHGMEHQFSPATQQELIFDDNGDLIKRRMNEYD
jgi:5-methylcytosine-specific restriction protein A